MANTFLFLAETNLSPSIAEQRKACEAAGDVIVEAGRISFLDLPKKLEQSGFELGHGDRIKIYDFTCLPVNTATLVRMLVKLLGKGVAIEFSAALIVLDPDGDNDEALRLLVALDSHWRRVHGMKTHPPHIKTGRKPRLKADQLPKIQAMLAAEGATYNSVASELGLARSTVFEFVKRHKPVAAEAS
ncbi:Hin recombinase [Sphingobium sp. 15-1]|uniref:Hin recombinase n=1 Tax=Sphingobium sp. 15-1 TaxID=2729616 RepID=UPI00159C9523|nr:Hin recombinase [Sphingobium sp. 15-1]